MLSKRVSACGLTDACGTPACQETAQRYGGTPQPTVRLSLIAGQDAWAIHARSTTGGGVALRQLAPIVLLVVLPYPILRDISRPAEVAPVMVVVAANEPVQSADYTSGLVRRRLSMAFRHRPAVPRDLLTWHAGAWHGELAHEISGVLNWVLALPDTQMEALLQQTTTLVPSLQATWAQSLVDTNPLAEWANQAILLDDCTDPQGTPLAVVNVGRAHKLDQTNGYEHQDRRSRFGRRGIAFTQGAMRLVRQSLEGFGCVRAEPLGFEGLRQCRRGRRCHQALGPGEVQQDDEPD
jgi:hypothetical protein